MPGPTNYPHGLSTERRQSTFGMLPIPNPVQLYALVDDFHRFDTDEYTLTENNNATILQIAALGGALELATTVDSGSACDLIANFNSFEFVQGKKLWFEGGLKVTAGTNLVQIQIGLQDVIGSTPPEGWHVTKDSGADVFHVNVKSGGDNQWPVDTKVVADYVEGESLRFGMYWDGVDQIYSYTNGVLMDQVTMDPDGSNPSLPQLPQGLLSPEFGIQGHTGVQTVELDYWAAFEEK